MENGHWLNSKFWKLSGEHCHWIFNVIWIIINVWDQSSKLTILLQHYFTMGICRSGVDCNKSRIKPEYSNFLLFSNYFGSVFFLWKVINVLRFLLRVLRLIDVRKPWLAAVGDRLPRHCVTLCFAAKFPSLQTIAESSFQGMVELVFQPWLENRKHRDDR